MSFAEYAAAGWKLCGIDKGSKAPKYDDWNEPDKLEATTAAADGLEGAGLAHADSGTAALDIDDMEAARPWLAEHGVDVDALMADPRAVMISSGRYNRAKLLYRLKLPMRTLKPKGSGIELRCATDAGKSVQDVLPPTVHPDTKKPYAWKYGDPLVAHWSILPPLPASVLALWRNLLSEIPPKSERSTEPRSDASLITVKKAIYQFIEQNHKDVTDYDDWIEIGMRLNDQTGGAQEGLDIWDEWSASDKSKRKDGTPRYQGREACEIHWRSFSSAGKNAIGMSAAINALPSEADEFDVVEEEDPSETTAAKLAEQAKATKQEAIAKLESQLIYVYSAEKYFDTKRRKVINTEAALQHMFTSIMPKGRGGKRLNPVDLLKESTTKKFVDMIGFHPGKGATFKDREDYTYANTFNGDRLAEPVQPTPQELEKIDWLFDRISDPAYREWLKKFYGHVVQHPGVKIKTAPLIWSETQGNGKTTLVRMIPSLLVGPRYSKEITHTQLEDGFTGYLVDAWHINLTEFRASSRNEREALSKKVESWIADDAVTVRPMHQVAYTMPNHFFVTGSSNFDDAASIGNQDRKWAIHELRAPQFTDAEQAWIYDEFLLTPRAAGVLRHYFLNVDLTGFVASARAIQTADRKEMIEASGANDVEALVNAFEERSGPFSRDVVLVAEIVDWVRKTSGFRPNMHRVGKLLSKAPFNGTNRRFRVGDSRYHGIIVRNHNLWESCPGKEIMDHIQGVTDDVSTDFDDESVDLLA